MLQSLEGGCDVDGPVCFYSTVKALRSGKIEKARKFTTLGKGERKLAQAFFSNLSICS